jgi:hypothetical protein
MIRRPPIAAFAVMVACAGCSTPEQQVENEAYRAPVYRTGSNLPAGRETSEAPKELSAAERRSLEDLQNRPRRPVTPLSN